MLFLNIHTALHMHMALSFPTNVSEISKLLVYTSHSSNLPFKVYGQSIIGPNLYHCVRKYGAEQLSLIISTKILGVGLFAERE